jgi:heme-degrading monooxygenase HmoA
MIVAVVRFPLPASMSADDAREGFEASAPRFQAMPGLLRKHYLRAEDGSVGGGVYLWESREAAEACYDDAFRARVKERYGDEPVIEIFETPVTVEPGGITVR